MIRVPGTRNQEQQQHMNESRSFRINTVRASDALQQQQQVENESRSFQVNQIVDQPKKASIMVKIRGEGPELFREVNKEAPETMISWRTYRTLGMPPLEDGQPSRPANVDQSIPIHGRTRLVVQHEGREENVSVFVTKCQYGEVIGRDLIKQESGNEDLGLSKNSSETPTSNSSKSERTKGQSVRINQVTKSNQNRTLKESDSNNNAQAGGRVVHTGKVTRKPSEPGSDDEIMPVWVKQDFEKGGVPEAASEQQNQQNNEPSKYGHEIKQPKSNSSSQQQVRSENTGTVPCFQIGDTIRICRGNVKRAKWFKAKVCEVHGQSGTLCVKITDFRNQPINHEIDSQARGHSNNNTSSATAKPATPKDDERA